jgi:hypothetical protein
MNQEQNAILTAAVTIAASLVNANRDEQASQFKKVKYPIDQKPQKHYPKPKGRDQRWR